MLHGMAKINKKDCTAPTIRHSGKDKTMKTVKRSVVARDEGEGMDKKVQYRGLSFFNRLYFLKQIEVHRH